MERVLGTHCVLQLLAYTRMYLFYFIYVAGGLYAGATAGGNVKAEAGLGGGVTAEKSAGSGFASAQAGDRFASSGLVRDQLEKDMRKEERLRRKELKKQKHALRKKD